jgi:hypothetical protein
MVNVTNRANVAVRLRPLKLFLRHLVVPCLKLETLVPARPILRMRSMRKSQLLDRSFSCGQSACGNAHSAFHRETPAIPKGGA